MLLRKPSVERQENTNLSFLDVNELGAQRGHERLSAKTRLDSAARAAHAAPYIGLFLASRDAA